MPKFRITVEYIGPDPVESVKDDWLNDPSWVTDIELHMREAALIGPNDHLTSIKLEAIEEQASENVPDLSCPYCDTGMIRAHWEIEGDWRVVWVCSCKPDADIIAAVEALRKKTGQCVVAMFGS